MINDEKKYELIKFKDGEFSLDVNVSPNEDTVWLTANEIALLFERDPKTIRKHINNVFEENEVDINSNTKKMRIAGVDQRVTFYSLDVIISVGYRVKSKRGVLFRQWANSILKQYLLNGHVINEERCLSCASNIISLQNDIKHIESKIKVIEYKVNLENSKIFYQGEILDAYTFIRKLFFLAEYEIIIVDYYADKFLLSMLKDIKTNITIITSTSSYLNKERIPTNIKIITNEDIHGRYLFIDDIGYIIDNSFNNIGKKRLLMMKLEDTKERILKGII